MATTDEIKVPDTPSVAAPTTTAPAPAVAPAPSIAEQAKSIADTGQYTATTGTFDESKGVEGRVNRISSSDSPLMQLAGTRAKQQANRTGLLNTSMAVGAGQKAVIDSALPIAQADAGAYQQQALANQSSLNDAAMRNAAARASAGTAGMQYGESARQFDVNQAGQTDRFNQELAQKESQFTRGMTHDVDMAKLDGSIRENLLGIEAKYKTEIAGNENIANAWGTVMSDISKIQNNPDLDSATKTALIQNTLAGFQSFTGFWQKATGGAVDVSDLLNFNIANAPGKVAEPAAPAAAPAPVAAPAPAPWQYEATGGI